MTLIQLLFNLWDTASWVPAHAGFDFHACYYFIIDFFDAAHGANAKARTRKLLDWWNMFASSFLSLHGPDLLSLGRYFRLVEVMANHLSQHPTKPWRLSELHER
jgi:hypothetical protein